MARGRLLLVVHGRTGGLIPEELTTLAAELGGRRDAPVRLQALTAAGPPMFPPSGSAAPLTLVPLFLLPGAHVRQDVPAIAAYWRRRGPVRRLPFLGAWPLWQRALADEVAEAMVQARAKQVAEGPTQADTAIDARPRLLHHPLEGPLAARFLAHLQAITQAQCHATPYSSADPQEPILALSGPVVPLALAANRLTEALGERVGPPLLARPRCRRLLLEQLEALP